MDLAQVAQLSGNRNEVVAKVMGARVFAGKGKGNSKGK